MPRLTLIALVGIAAALGCGSDVLREREVKALYSAAVRISVDLLGDPGTLVIQGNAPSENDPFWFTASSESDVQDDQGEFSRYLQSRMPDLTRSAWLRFYEKNRSPQIVPDSLNLPRPYVYWYPDRTWPAIVEEIGQPYVLLMLSQPGYDPKSRVALVHVSVASSRPGRAGGWYLLFRKTENVWAAVDTAASWIQ